MTNNDTATATEVFPLAIGQQYVEAHNLIARAERYEDRAVTCSRCHGRGTLPYTFANGICFKCDGTRGQKADEALMDEAANLRALATILLDGAKAMQAARQAEIDAENAAAGPHPMGAFLADMLAA